MAPLSTSSSTSEPTFTASVFSRKRTPDNSQGFDWLSLFKTIKNLAGKALERMKAEAIEQEVGMEKKARQQMELEHSITVAKLNQKVNTQATTTNGYISRDGQDKRARFHFHSQKSGINAGTLSNDPLVRIIREERIETTKTISALEVENKVIRPQLHKAQQPQMVDAKSREIRKLTVQLKATAKKNEKLSETNKAQARDLNILRKSTVAQQKLHFSIPRWCWCLGSGDEVTVF